MRLCCRGYFAKKKKKIKIQNITIICISTINSKKFQFLSFILCFSYFKVREHILGINVYVLRQFSGKKMLKSYLLRFHVESCF